MHLEIQNVIKRLISVLDKVIIDLSAICRELREIIEKNKR